jgi:hypothetical protein
MDKPPINAPAAELLFELIDGPADPKRTWVVSTEANSGVLGTLARLTAAQASTPPAPGRKTAAAHAAHLLFAIELATRRVRGEDPPADWDASWEPATVDDAAWRRLCDDLRQASVNLRTAILEGETWTAMMLQGIVATVAHTAYHLGALRQMLPPTA